MRHYQAVLALKRYSTTTAAADHLGLSQSAISHQLSECERRLGRKLFTRVGRHLHLTTAGNMLAESAVRILKEAYYIEKALDPNQLDPDLVSLRLGIFSYNSFRWFTRFYKEQKHRFPKLVVEMVSTVDDCPFGAIESGEVDFGIIGGEFKDGSLELFELFNDKLVCVMPKSHKLSGRKFVVAEDFLSEPFITYSMRNEGGHEGDLLFGPSDERPKHYLLGGNVEVVLEMVKNGLGLSILSQWSVDCSAVGQEVHVVPVTRSGISIQWYFAFRKSHENYDTLLKLAKSLRNWCKETKFPR